MQTGFILASIATSLIVVGLLINLGLLSAIPFTGLKLKSFSVSSTFFLMGIIMFIIVGVLVNYKVLSVEGFEEEKKTCQ